MAYFDCQDRAGYSAIGSRYHHPRTLKLTQDPCQSPAVVAVGRRGYGERNLSHARRRWCGRVVAHGADASLAKIEYNHRLQNIINLGLLKGETDLSVIADYAAPFDVGNTVAVEDDAANGKGISGFGLR